MSISSRFPQTRDYKSQGWQRAKKEDESRTEGGEREARRYAQKRDLLIVRSSDNDLISGSPTIFARRLFRFEEEGQYRELQESSSTKERNYPREECLRQLSSGEQLS